MVFLGALNVEAGLDNARRRHGVDEAEIRREAASVPLPAFPAFPAAAPKWSAKAPAPVVPRNSERPTSVSSSHADITAGLALKLRAAEASLRQRELELLKAAAPAPATMPKFSAVPPPGTRPAFDDADHRSDSPSSAEAAERALANSISQRPASPPPARRSRTRPLPPPAAPMLAEDRLLASLPSNRPPSVLPDEARSRSRKRRRSSRPRKKKGKREDSREPSPPKLSQYRPAKGGFDAPTQGLSYEAPAGLTSGLNYEGVLANLPVDPSSAFAPARMLVGSQLVDQVLYKTRLCQWFEEGMCHRGDSCTFAHGMHELGQDPASAQIDVSQWKLKLCVWFDHGLCRRGSQCSYAHGPEELEHGRSKAGDFAGLGGSLSSGRMTMDFTGVSTLRTNLDFAKSFVVPAEQIEALMTPHFRDMLLEASGVKDIQWQPEEGRVKAEGDKLKVDKVGELIQRVTTHCLWGVSESKITALIRPRTDYFKALIRLAPMVPQLTKAQASLDNSKRKFSIGTDPANDLKVKGPLVSRAHTNLEFIPSKGAIYITDTSTNGTFLNGRRLPAKGSARVVLWHGDELLLQDPASNAEFGFMVNIEMK